SHPRVPQETTKNCATGAVGACAPPSVSLDLLPCPYSSGAVRLFYYTFEQFYSKTCFCPTLQCVEKPVWRHDTFDALSGLGSLFQRDFEDEIATGATYVSPWRSAGMSGARYWGTVQLLDLQP